MLGLAENLAGGVRSTFLSFSEDGLCRVFLDQLRRGGFSAHALRHDTPRLLAALKELKQLLKRSRADLLICHGYKADLLGLFAARRLRIAVIAVSRGFTGENRRVRLYESLDRFVLRWMDRVVCVSQGQAEKIHRAGVAAHKTTVIRNSVDAGQFLHPQPDYADRLRNLFSHPPELIVGAAGRLSPEKGFEVLVQAAAEVVRANRSVGFVLFGDGPLADPLKQRIEASGLRDRFVLAGFHADYRRYLPHFDLLVLPSFTEGLPNVVLEALAAAVPVVATAVGGTPEVLDDGVSGHLVPPRDPGRLADRIGDLLADDARRRQMGTCGRERVAEDFSFAAQARAYRQLFHRLIPSKVRPIELSGQRNAVCSDHIDAVQSGRLRADESGHYEPL